MLTSYGPLHLTNSALRLYMTCHSERERQPCAYQVLLVTTSKDASRLEAALRFTVLTMCGLVAQPETNETRKRRSIVEERSVKTKKTRKDGFRIVGCE